jgi:hypothetical protein
MVKVSLVTDLASQILFSVSGGRGMSLSSLNCHRPLATSPRRSQKEKQWIFGGLREWCCGLLVEIACPKPSPEMDKTAKLKKDERSWNARTPSMFPLPTFYWVLDWIFLFFLFVHRVMSSGHRACNVWAYSIFHLILNYSTDYK